MLCVVFSGYELNLNKVLALNISAIQMPHVAALASVLVPLVNMLISCNTVLVFGQNLKLISVVDEIFSMYGIFNWGIYDFIS